MEASNRGAGETAEPRDPALGEHVSTSQGQPAQRQSFFAALCSQPGQWDPSVNEGPPQTSGSNFVGEPLSSVALGVKNTPFGWLMSLVHENGLWEGPLFV